MSEFMQHFGRVNKNISIEELKTLLGEMDKYKSFVEYDMRDLNWGHNDKGEFVLKLTNPREGIAGDYRLTDYAFTQFLKALKIPKSYFVECSDELREKELSEGFDKLVYTEGTKKDRAKPVRFLTYFRDDLKEEEGEVIGKEPVIYGMTSNRVTHILPSEIFDTVIEGIGRGKEVNIDESYFDLEEFRVRFVSKEKGYIEKDEEFPGVDFKYSEVLKHPLILQTILYRKVCGNGLVLPVDRINSFKMQMGRYDESILKEQLEHIETQFDGLSSISKVMENLKKIVLPKALTGIDLSDKDRERNAFDDIFEYVLPKKTEQVILSDLIRAEFNEHEENLTVNGVVNAVTRTARDLTNNTEKVYVESVAGKFVSRLTTISRDLESKKKEFVYSKDTIDHYFKKKKKITDRLNVQNEVESGNREDEENKD